MKKLNYYLGAVVSSWILFAMIALTEFWPPFKPFLISLAGHHWIAKGITVFSLFILVSVLFSDVKKIGNYSVNEAAWKSVVSVLVLIVLLFLFIWFMGI